MQAGIMYEACFFAAEYSERIYADRFCRRNIRNVTLLGSCRTGIFYRPGGYSIGCERSKKTWDI